MKRDVRVACVLLPALVFAAVLTTQSAGQVLPSDTPGGNRFALVVSGASGEAKYADTYNRLRNELALLLVERYGFEPDKVTLLAENEDASRGIGPATAAGVTASLESFRARCSAGDLLLIVLIGHGSLDGDRAKFNLVGPDLDQSAWASLLAGIRARVVMVNTASASSPFIQALAAPDRIVITATDRPSQVFETVFPAHFVEALADEGTDANHDGRTSVAELFAAASERVRAWYESQGRMPAERAALDDLGEGVGKQAGAPPSADAPADRVYLDREATATAGDAGGAAGPRAAVLAKIAELRSRKAEMTPQAYEAALQALLLELARLR